MQRQRCQRADSNFEAVRRSGPIVSVVLHVPKVAELMLGS